MTFQPAHKDTTNPPGQVVNPIPRDKTIGGIIDRVVRSELPAMKLETKGNEEVYQQGYAAGYVDGKAEGFREGLAWMSGKSI